jgi:hypothetical protein
MENKLAAKIANARKQLGSLRPDKVNKDQNYQYISADKVLERGGDVLAEIGIAIIPMVEETTITAVERPNKSPRLDALLKMSFIITDGQTEYTATWTACGSDYMTPDKAVYKAITSGHKYFLMKLLNIGVGNEDAEHENAEPEAQPAPADMPAITPDELTLEQACELLNSAGVRYGDIDTEKLSFIANNAKTPPLKKRAAALIIDSRN